MVESCIFCEYQLDPQKGNPGKTSNSLKTLFQFLNVNVVGRSTTSSSSVSVFVEEEVGWIASKICEDCAIVANGFGTMADSFDKVLQNFLKQWIRKLASRANDENKNNKSLLTPDDDATTSTTPSVSPGDGLRAEILRKWELKLNPDKSASHDEQLLPREQQEDHSHNILEHYHHHQSEDKEVSGQLESAASTLDHTTNYHLQKASEERPTTTRNHVNGENDQEPVAPPPPPQEWRTLNCRTSSDDAREVHAENTTFSRPRDVAGLPDGGMQLQSKDLSSPITSIPTPTSTTAPAAPTPTPFTNSRTCLYPNCGMAFRGPKASERKHYTCVHTVEYFPTQFLGFSQKDVNELTRGICSQEFSQDLLSKEEEEEEELNTFKCPFCAATGIKDTDKKFHILEQHQEVVKSRLEARRTVVALNANNNHLDEPTNSVDEPQLHNHKMPIFREEGGEHGDDVGQQDGGMDEQLEQQDGEADEKEEEEEERPDEEMEQDQMEKLEEDDDDECHDMEEDQLDDEEEEEDDRGAQKDVEAADWDDDSSLEQEDADGPPKLEIPCYTCGYCELRLYGHHADLNRHMICNHTVAYFTRWGQLPRSTSEEDVDRVILGLRQQGLFSDPDKQDTFTCSFCKQQQSVTGDKKYHLLKQHLNLVQSRLKEVEKTVVVTNNTQSEISEQQPPPEPPPVPLSPSQQLVSIKREVAADLDSTSTSTPVVAAAAAESPAAPPDVQEIQATFTTPTEQIARRQRDKADFDQNREALMVNTVTKPRFTLIFLIQRAIADSPNGQLKAKDICSWIKSNVGYYRNQRRAKALRTTVPSTLSRSNCFLPLDPLVKDGAWKVKGKEFYKCGREWSSSVPSSSKSGVTSSSTTTPPPVPVVAVNVKIEDLEGDSSSIQQSSSTQNGQLAPPPLPPPPPQGNLDLGTNQCERPGGSSRNKVVVEVGNNRRPRPRGRSTTSKRGRNCDFCGKWISGPNANLERHNMCTHSTRYFSQHLRPGTSQGEVNRAVASLSEECIIKSIISSSGHQKRRRRSYHCSLCQTDRVGEAKYHLFKEHFRQVLTRLEGGGGGDDGACSGAGVSVPTRNFDNALASADLLGIIHIKQERNVPMEQE